MRSVNPVHAGLWVIRFWSFSPPRPLRPLFVAVLLNAFTVPAWAASPILTADTDIATAGYYRLAWQVESDAATRFEVQEASERGFEHPVLIYQGPDRARFMSGRGDGVYWYRVRVVGAEAWSAPVRVAVAHHPLSRALAFFAVGAGVFMATALVIVVGIRQTKA